MYKIVRFLSFIFRNFFLLNPFESLQGQTIYFQELEIPIIPKIKNY